MRQLFAIILLVSSFSIKAQSQIKASDIIRQINEGREVKYSNVEIVGDLDLTDLRNRHEQHDDSWFGRFSDWGGNDTFISTVEVPLIFSNCTFTGDVLAYYHIDRKDATYLAHFERDVIFKNCVFKRGSEFKYSEFEGSADFTGATFNETANFKYSEFSEGPKFAQVKFEDGADFKYTEFPRNTSFERATFYGLANFKYSKFKSPLNIEKVAFKGSEDFKYTRIDGESFTGYLIDGDRD